MPSTVDVHRYMLERTEDCPYRQACIIELRYAEIMKLLKMSARVGRRGSVALFFHCNTLCVAALGHYARYRLCPSRL